jgi:hypothetical protein
VLILGLCFFASRLQLRFGGLNLQTPSVVALTKFTCFIGRGDLYTLKEFIVKSD